MNIKIISYFLGWVLKIESVALLLSTAVSLVFQNDYWWILLIIAAATFLCGMLLSPKSFKQGAFYSREGCVATALGWVVMSMIGAIPYTVTGVIPNYIDALFEISSGFTTTGASILDEVEHLGKGLLFFRSFTHWIGGMGVLVLILAILPFSGSGNHMQLMKAESPGPQVSKFVPRVRDTAIVLYLIYIGMTALCIINLLICGMDVFDSFCMGIATAGTGGFAVRNVGMGDYNDACIISLSVWMLLFGVNFNVYYLILNKKIKEAFRSEEVKTYAAIVGGAILLIGGSLFLEECKTAEGLILNTGKIYPAFRASLFTVAATVSSTGFTMNTFEAFSVFGRMLIVFLMFVGACGGSTGGGFKVSRVILLLKSAGRELHLLVHPNAVRVLKFEGKKADDRTVTQVCNYFIIFATILGISLFIVCLDPAIQGFTQGFTSVLTCLNNIGPAFADQTAGWVPSFSQYSWVSKLVLIFDMIAGRLELFPMLMLFSKRTWKKSE